VYLYNSDMYLTLPFLLARTFIFFHELFARLEIMPLKTPEMFLASASLCPVSILLKVGVRLGSV